MKQFGKLVLLFGILLIFGLAATNTAMGSVHNLPEPAAADQPGSGMPGWPVPDKPIPQHEPGRPSRASGYSTQVTQINAAGEEELVSLTGLDAMLADGTIPDPLAGSYRLVSKEDILIGIFDSGDSSLDFNTYEGITVTHVVNSDISLAPVNIQSLDITAGDLNGDGVDEQIAAWVDVASENIFLAIGEMEGTDGRSSSDPAAAASNGNIDLVVRGYDQALWHAHYDGNDWGEWDNDGGGLLLSGPAIAARDSGTFDVFAVGFTGDEDFDAGIYTQVYQRHWDGAGWAGLWAGLPVDDLFTTVPAWMGPPPELPAPAAVASGAGILDVFRVAPDNTLRWNHFNGSAWGSWQDLGGMLASGPGALLLDDGRLQVFAVDVDQALWHRTCGVHPCVQVDDWGPWQRLELTGMDEGVTIASAPTPVQLTNGDVKVYVRGSDEALWQVTFNGSTWEDWQSLSGDDLDLASRSAAAGSDLFALAPDGRMLHSIDDGDTWSDFANHWLPACCLGTPIDTGIHAYVTEDPDVVDQINVLDIETGHFLGDRRQQIALAYTWDDPDLEPEELGDTGIGLRLFDIDDGFRTLSPLGGLGGIEYEDLDYYEEDYYPKIAVGEFDDDAPQEIALAYATRKGSVRVYNEDDFEGRELAWLKAGTYNFDDKDEMDMEDVFNNRITSIKISPGWKACFHANWSYDIDGGDPHSCFGPETFEITINDLAGVNYQEGGGGMDDTISRVEVEQVGTFDLDPVNVLDGIYKQNNAHIAVEIINFDPQNQELTRAAADYFEMKPADGNHYPAPERTLEIAAGDFDGESNDEIAILYDIYCEGDLCNDAYYVYFNILEVEDMKITTHDGYAETRKWVDDSDDNDGIPTADIHLTTGDFDGDGRDEIVRTWPTYDEFNVGDWGDFDRSLQVLDWGGSWSEPISEYLPPWTYHSHQDALVAGDLNLDLKDEIVFLKCTYNKENPFDYDQLLTFTLSPSTGLELTGEEDMSFGDNVPVLATGDFTGESLRVGPPTYRVQNEMTTPIMFLNLPPMHRDIIGDDQVIEVINDAYAQYDTEIASAEVYSTESKREWDLSTGMEMSVGGGGHRVSASLENTYGENFSRATTQITEKVISEQTTASEYDQIIYNGTDYAIWEYPVYGTEADNPDQAQTISVVWPLTDQTNVPATRRSTWCDENFYTPGHQLYNVWSYGDTALGDNGFKDLGEKILEKQTTGGTEISMRMSENSGATRSSGHHNQISAGLEYSYKYELNIPFVGSVFDYSFRAYADGSYGHESLSTFSTEVTEDTGIKIGYPSITSLPEIRAYLYWAKAGYLVADYQTSPDIYASPWSRYDKPDPAFILPWYGFPDPTDPVAPACGPAKQLFTHDIELDPAYVQNGDTLTMTATVRNFSAQLLSNVTVRFYLGEPAVDNDIGECSIDNLNRNLGPKRCSDIWVVSGGSGEEKIHAVIDPGNAIDEMHEQGDLINNNIGYGLLHVANADYQDPGLRAKQAYQAILYEDTPGLGFGIYLPTANINETVRYELAPTDLGEVQIVGDPIQVLAFRGGEQEPDENHTFSPTPAGMVAFYRDADLLPGMVEANLKLYRLGSSGWEEAICSSYDLIRFPDDNRLAMPICQTGVYVLSDQQPVMQWDIYLPLSLK